MVEEPQLTETSTQMDQPVVDAHSCRPNRNLQHKPHVLSFWSHTQVFAAAGSIHLEPLSSRGTTTWTLQSNSHSIRFRRFPRGGTRATHPAEHIQRMEPRGFWRHKYNLDLVAFGGEFTPCLRQNSGYWLRMA